MTGLLLGSSRTIHHPASLLGLRWGSSSLHLTAASFIVGKWWGIFAPGSAGRLPCKAPRDHHVVQPYRSTFSVISQITPPNRATKGGSLPSYTLSLLPDFLKYPPIVSTLVIVLLVFWCLSAYRVPPGFLRETLCSILTLKSRIRRVLGVLGVDPMPRSVSGPPRLSREYSAVRSSRKCCEYRLAPRLVV